MEVIGVDLNEPLPFAGNSALFKDGVNGAGRLAGAAINAECGIYVILLVFFGGMYAVDWTDIYAGCILLADAGLSNDIGHFRYTILFQERGEFTSWGRDIF